MDDDQAKLTNKHEEFKIGDDQSQYSRFTRNNFDSPFDFGVNQQSHSFSPTSSITPDGSGGITKEFNPNEYTVEIYQDTTFDQMVSQKSIDTPSNRGHYFSNQEQSSNLSPHQYNRQLQNQDQSTNSDFKGSQSILIPTSKMPIMISVAQSENSDSLNQQQQQQNIPLSSQTSILVNAQSNYKECSYKSQGYQEFQNRRREPTQKNSNPELTRKSSDYLPDFDKITETPKNARNTFLGIYNQFNNTVKHYQNQNSLSPFNHQDKSPRSITTLSAISTKVNGKKLINQYVIIQTIGRGKYSKVAQCMDQNTKQVYAMKQMNKVKLKKIFIGKHKVAYSAVETEIAILKKLDHPNIVRLFEIIDDPKHDKIYLISEYVKNGALTQRIFPKNNNYKIQSKFGDLNEDQIRKYFRQIISAIEYCHENAKIIHRDIKPDNILIDENDQIKLSDFGVSFMMEDGKDELSTSAGSYYYYSPEACLGSTYKGKKSDIWACGVTLYLMIYKQHPFEDKSIPDLFKKIQNDEPTYRPGKPGVLQFTVSQSLKDLIKSILTKNPENRISIAQMKSHPWVTQNGSDPMYELQKMEYNVSEQEMQNVFGKVNIFKQVVLKKLSKNQNSNPNKTYNLLTQMLRKSTQFQDSTKKEE